MGDGHDHDVDEERKVHRCAQPGPFEEDADAALCERVRDIIPDDRLVCQATEIFAALADSTRFRVLTALMEGPLRVGDLVSACNVSQSAVSHQLRLLRDRDLVASSRDGQSMIYSLSDDHVRTLLIVAVRHADERLEG